MGSSKTECSPERESVVQSILKPELAVYLEFHAMKKSLEKACLDLTPCNSCPFLNAIKGQDSNNPDEKKDSNRINPWLNEGILDINGGINILNAISPDIGIAQEIEHAKNTTPNQTHGIDFSKSLDLSELTPEQFRYLEQIPYFFFLVFNYTNIQKEKLETAQSNPKEAKKGGRFIKPFYKLRLFNIYRLHEKKYMDNFKNRYLAGSLSDYLSSNTFGVSRDFSKNVFNTLSYWFKISNLKDSDVNPQ